MPLNDDKYRSQLYDREGKALALVSKQAANVNQGRRRTLVSTACCAAQYHIVPRSRKKATWLEIYARLEDLEHSHTSNENQALPSALLSHERSE